MASFIKFGPLVSEEMSFKEIVDRRTHGRTHVRTDGRRTIGDHKNSPCHSVTGELKKNNINIKLF